MMANSDSPNDMDYPREYGSAGQDKTVAQGLEELEPGDRVLWGDRKVPCVVARVVTADDRIGQSLTASVLRGTPPAQKEDWWSPPEYGRPLQPGDVFLRPTRWNLTGDTFVLIQGPRGGFYALTRRHTNGRTRVAMFRAIRSYHATSFGRKGEGSFAFDQWFDDVLTVVEPGDEPEVLDEGGDLPTYDQIKDKTIAGYLPQEDRRKVPDDAGKVAHFDVGTVAEAFDEGLETAHNRANREFRATLPGFDDEGEENPHDRIPSAERVEVAGSPDGYSHSTMTVEEIIEDEYGLKAVLDAPAPWDTPDGEMPFNEAIKKTPWDETHRTFDGDRKAWLVDADELVGVASVLADFGYSTVVEADLGGR